MFMVIRRIVTRWTIEEHPGYCRVPYSVVIAYAVCLYRCLRVLIKLERLIFGFGEHRRCTYYVHVRACVCEHLQATAPI